MKEGGEGIGFKTPTMRNGAQKQLRGKTFLSIQTRRHYAIRQCVT